MWLFLLIVTGLAEGCSWLEAIKEKRAKIQLFGEGLHRKLSIDTHLASVNRFSDCRLLYELTIPAGAYIDSDTWAVRFLGIKEFRANASLPGHVVHARHRFDVEAPRERSDSQKIWLLSNIQTRKSFVIEEKFHLAVHIRYHRAVEGSSQVAKVQFTSPLVTLDCPSDFVPLHLSSCKGKRFPGVPSFSPSWILIEPLEKTTVTATVPVADRNELRRVLGATAVAICLGLGMIFTSSSSSKLDG